MYRKEDLIWVVLVCMQLPQINKISSFPISFFHPYLSFQYTLLALAVVERTVVNVMGCAQDRNNMNQTINMVSKLKYG